MHVLKTGQREGLQGRMAPLLKADCSELMLAVASFLIRAPRNPGRLGP